MIRAGWRAGGGDAAIIRAEVPQSESSMITFMAEHTSLARLVGNVKAPI